VNDFKSSLSQHNELNYYTVPLCNYKNPLSQDETSETKHIKKSNPAIKSKPIIQLIDEEDSLKCKLCDWNYPKGFAQQDKDSHYERCKNGYGEGDKKLWSKCKSDRALFRYSSLESFENRLTLFLERKLMQEKKQGIKEMIIKIKKKKENEKGIKKEKRNPRRRIKENVKKKKNRKRVIRKNQILQSRWKLNLLKTLILMLQFQRNPIPIKDMIHQLLLKFMI